MNHTSPFSFLQSLAQAAGRLQPPQWLADEAQLRLILLANHVLAQEPEAQTRLARRQSSVIEVRWNQVQWKWRITPAGLLDRADAQASPDLVMSLDGQSPVQLLKLWIDGQRPPVQIEGDVQLAAEVNWLIDHVRWDFEEDLSKLLGDAAAHTLVTGGHQMWQALQKFVGKSAGTTDLHRTTP